MKTKILISLFVCFVFFAAKHSAAQNINPGSQIKWPESCATASVYSPSTNTCINAAGVVSNLPTVYPAQCQGTNRPSWCSGSTAGSFIISACGQLPSTGGFVNLLGLTGTIPGQVACSAPAKQIIFVQDPTSSLVITENDGRITFPLDNNSMFVGPGAGQCRVGTSEPFGGISLDPSANVEAIIGPAHVDGTQEEMSVTGVCLWGFTGATVSKGLVEIRELFTNTTVANNNLNVCNHACLWIENSGSITVYGNEFDVTDGAYSVFGTPLVIMADGTNGCGTQSVNVWGADAEHANGGAGNPEILITGDGAGAQVCTIHVHDLHVERNVSGTPSTIGIKISDCLNCKVDGIEFAGGTGSGSGDAINISETAPGRTQNVVILSAADYFLSYQNTINDSTPGGKTLSLPANEYITSYVAQPGYQQPPVLPSTTIQSLGTDAMAGQGNLATGTGQMGANFEAYGCVPSEGVTCTYTRTNSTAPPGYTYSQVVQITSNTDTSVGNNGIEYLTAVSFTAGSSYQVSFWGKGDGTFTGIAQFILGDPNIPVTYCTVTAPQSLTSTWTLYSGVCTPTASGTSYLSFSALSAPVGVTGTFYLGGLVFNPITPLTLGVPLVPAGPYGLAAAPGVLYSAAGNPLPTCNAAIQGRPLTVSDAAATPTWHGTYASGGAITSNVICSYNGSTYSWLYQ